MSISQKLWSNYPGWYERDAPIRGGVIEATARVLGKVHNRMTALERERFAEGARTTTQDPGGIDQQPDGPWKVFWISPDVPIGVRFGVVGNETSRIVGLLQQGQGGVPGSIQLKTYTGPGLYKFESGLSGRIWVIVGALQGLQTGYFVHTGRMRYDFLAKVAYERGFTSTVKTDAATGAVFRAMLLHFIRSKRCGMVSLAQALALYAGNRAGVQAYREDWTGRIYGGHAYCGFAHYHKRSYSTTIWRQASQHVGRVFVSVADPLLLQGQELGIVLKHYLAAGIEAVMVPVQVQTGPPPLPVPGGP